MKTAAISLRMSQDMRAALDAIAEFRGQSITTTLERLVLNDFAALHATPEWQQYHSVRAKIAEMYGDENP